MGSKRKKILSFILAVAMVLTMIPATAIAAPSDEGYTQIGTSDQGEYVDKTAANEEAYEYVVEGSDGSVTTVAAVDPVAATGTGNTVTKSDPVQNVYYEKVTDLSQPINNESGYLLVAEDASSKGTYYAITNAATTKGVVVEGTRITGDHADSEWTVNKNQKISFKNSEGKWLDIFEETFLFWLSYNLKLNTKPQELFLGIEDNKISLGKNFQGNTVSKYIGVTGAKINFLDNPNYQFNLYKKNIETVPAGWTVDTTGLDALLAEADTKVQNEYTKASWEAFAKAKKDAETVKNSLKNPYATEQEANAALADIDKVHKALKDAMDQLELLPTPDSTSPTITWKRTWEPEDFKVNKIVTNVQQLVDKAPWGEIIWNWNDIKHLTAENSKVWDYNNKDRKQYSNAVKNSKVTSAATWNKGYMGNWTDSSVRRFTGTFTWPAGYSLDSTVVLESVNDGNYKEIYDYIDSHPALKERYGNSKVLPINDDMYVFISKETDDISTWTQDDAMKHMAFWTGSSGKGIWSKKGNTGEDWGRKVPPTFNGKSALPAFYQSWPNLEDRQGQNNNVVDYTTDVMNHTDGWYTLTDKEAFGSALHNLYGKEKLDNQKMRIDIFSFDNSDKGGMDELKLTLTKPQETQAKVTVRYWLDGVNVTPLGETILTKNIGDIVNLPNGTNTNELNHKKAEAIRKSNANVDVNDGVQQQKDYKVVEGENIIDIVYTSKMQGVKYFTYDFGVKNKYVYNDESTDDIKSVKITGTNAKLFSNITFSGHEITFEYTPNNALGNPERATLVVRRKNKTKNAYPICIIPASNILYEENMMNVNTGKETRAEWQKKGQYWGNDGTESISDNIGTLFGFTSKLDNKTNSNGQYVSTVTETGDTRYTKDLTFLFKGIGFDLIGECGPNTGTLIVMAKSKDGKGDSKNFVIDTYFNDSNVGTIYQVPLLHTMLRAGEYNVVVRGANVPHKSKASTMSMSGNGVVSMELLEAMHDMGMTDKEIEKTEFIGMDDILAANTFSLEDQPKTKEVKTPSDMRVAIDGFRVYRASDNAKDVYPEKEQNAVYTNVMKDGIMGNFAAYIEPNKTGDAQKDSFTVGDYEKLGGPENEIYLKPGTSVAFSVEGVTSGKVQISARAVAKQTEMNHQQIMHNTEMYYEVAVENGVATVSNTGKNLLALGNLKNNITALNETQIQQALLMVENTFEKPVEPETPQYFEPATFNIEAKTRNFFTKKHVTLTVTTSKDVDYIMVNDKKVMPDKGGIFDWLKPSNKNQNTFTVKETVKRGTTVNYKVIAYDKNNVASKEYTVQK